MTPAEREKVAGWLEWLERGYYRTGAHVLRVPGARHLPPTVLAVVVGLLYIFTLYMAAVLLMLAALIGAAHIFDGDRRRY